MANKVSVINPSYCVPQSITLQINTEKRVAYSETDDRLFYIEDTFFTLHDRRVLYDNTKNPIVTFIWLMNILNVFYYDFIWLMNILTYLNIHHLLFVSN